MDMEYAILTGISESAMEDFKKHMLRTIEIRTPQNFFTSLKVSVGDTILLTRTSAQDLTNGCTGVLARVLKHQISTHRTFTGINNFYEECETAMIRLQLQPRGTARITRVISNEIGDPTIVNAEEMCFYEAR